MLKYVEGDLFCSPAQVLVNTVNTVGVMGKGIALEFKKKYPKMFSQYKEQCDKHRMVIGKLMLWYAPDYWILQFPTKEHWRSPSKLEYIEKGLMTFVRKYANYNISSIAFPKLGCGNGELDWNDVKPLMEKYLKDLPIEVFIYLGKSEVIQPEHKFQNDMDKFLKKDERDLSFTGVQDMICHNTLMMPIKFEHNGDLWEAHWKKDKCLTFANNSEVIKLETGKVHQLWDEICAQRLFSVNEKDNNTLIFDLLSRMGYLQKVRVNTEEDDNMLAGYQLGLGKGRAYLVK
jgi:appr-1-p processing domain protein